jgi:hypothetical protein
MTDEARDYAAEMQGCPATWGPWLVAWKETVYPVFAAHGISVEGALIVYHLNQIVNAVAVPPNEDWQPGD